jgi:lactoylglutathione lyase|tara:strand:+ start:127 stop:561 length:435 start_codon:yes stop_codon:yes gene_type:complete
VALIRHVGIVVTDIEQSLQFYKDVLGFKILKKADESGTCIDNFLNIQNTNVTTVKMIDPNNNILELLYFNSHPELSDTNKLRRLTEIGCSHFALTVNDLDTLYSTLKEQGIEFNHPPQVSDDGNVKVAFCRDPDGTFIEMVEEL